MARAETAARLTEAEDLLRRLLKWDREVFGGSEATVWDDVRSFLGEDDDEDCQGDDLCNCGCNALT